ncbi:MAG: ATP-dependent DNA ligase [Actinobacteria bacterium]|nr:ATP-dependent DNA ligase [Actinomycetota bacterium]
MLLAELVETSAAVTATRSRNAKTAAVAELLRRLDPEEVAIGVAWLSGQPRQDRLEVGWAAVREVDAPPAELPTLTLTEADAVLEELAGVEAGSGSRGGRLERLRGLLARATAPEQAFLRGLVLRELRQGAQEGVMVQAIAAAAEVDEAPVRRAVMVHPDLGAVARAAIAGGEAALAAFRLEVFTPVLPMLAGTAADAGDAMSGLGAAIVEDKLDGARVQVHRAGDEVRVYTRNLRDVTGRLPEVVAVARQVEASSVVLDGEAIALRPDGTPEPFQVTMARFGRDHGSDTPLAGATPLRVFLFDVLHVDGEDVIDRPTTERRELLHRIVPAEHRVGSELVSDAAGATEVLRRALEAGHEGVMVKAVDAPYEAGRRGSGWRKVKPAHTLDLVVLAAEWGSGRRTGWLSNLHLGARDDRGDGGGFVMLGKTFKGLTDEVLRWQTEALLEREVRRTRNVVHVRPELVVEIAIDGVQASTRYPGGVALRFARVKGYRPDKSPADADTLATVQAIHRGDLRATV